MEKTLEVVSVWIRVGFVFTEAPETYWAPIGLSDCYKKNKKKKQQNTMAAVIKYFSYFPLFTVSEQIED